MENLLAVLMCVVMLTYGVASIATAENKTTVNLSKHHPVLLSARPPSSVHERKARRL